MTSESAGRISFRNVVAGDLPVILAAAVVQGWSLYALHYCVDHMIWPATSPGWLTALYAVAAVAPLTLQVLAAHIRQRLTWMVIAALVAFYFLVGWHYGAHIFEEGKKLPDQWPALGLVLVLQWLLIIPFVQARLSDGRWRARYELLFASAWNNKILLAEAVAFTGLFWLMLFLWGQLFKMLGIEFFKELFEEPIFVYPVTSIVFGIALKLIGSVEKLTRVVLEQTLSVLKWLALLAGVILAFFTIALIAKLPGMIGSGERAIGAEWLLWLVAVTVLLLNAAYRDGSVSTPYPRVIGLALRFVVPLTVVIALTAIYALVLRVHNYGFTVSRVWACIVGGAAVLYSIGYALAARDKEQWMGSIARVNVFTALYLIAAITLATTPVLSPYLIAANSQFAMTLQTYDGGVDENRSSSSMQYLRFDAGNYGRTRLEELSRIDGHTHAASIRAEAKSLLAASERYAGRKVDRSAQLDQIVVKPEGRTLDPQLTQVLKQKLAESTQRIVDGQLAGIFIDLNSDQTDEFVLLVGSGATLYRNDGVWKQVGDLTNKSWSHSKQLHEQIRSGGFHSQPSQWNDLIIGSWIFRTEVDSQ